MQRLLHLLSSGPSVDVLKVPLVDPEHNGKFRRSPLCRIDGIKPSDFFNLIVCKLCIVVIVSSWIFHSSSFLHAVMDVISLRSEKSMLWVAAPWVVARMTDEKPLRNGSICQFKAEPVTHYRNSVSPDLTVSGLINGAKPGPAFTFISLPDPGPEPLKEGELEFFNPGLVCLNANIASCHSGMIGMI